MDLEAYCRAGTEMLLSVQLNKPARDAKKISNRYWDAEDRLVTDGIDRLVAVFRKGADRKSDSGASMREVMSDAVATLDPETCLDPELTVVIIVDDKPQKPAPKAAEWRGQLQSELDAASETAPSPTTP